MSEKHQRKTRRVPKCPACGSASTYKKVGGFHSGHREHSQDFGCRTCPTHFDAFRSADGWECHNIKTIE